LVDKLQIDPANPGEVYLLVGYLGPSSRSGYWRVYHSREFNHFTDVPEEAIAHVEPTGGDGGPATIYVKGRARVFVTRVESVTLGARYLRGRIARTNLPAAAGPAARGHGKYMDDTCVVSNCQDSCCTENQTGFPCTFLCPIDD
jgi:hypothetical protein